MTADHAAGTRSGRNPGTSAPGVYERGAHERSAHEHPRGTPPEDGTRSTVPVIPNGPSVGSSGLAAATEWGAPRDEPAELISLRTLQSALWRHRRLWLITALVGTLIGACLHLVVPRKFASETNLYLVQPSGSDPAQAMGNDLSLLHTRTVAERAIAAEHLKVPTSTFLSSYRGSAASGVVMSITLTASSPHQSVASSNAVADAFLAFRAEEFRQQTDVLIGGLRAQIATLDTDINQLTNSVNTQSAPGAGSASQLTNLASERSADTTQVTQLEAQIQQDQLDVSSVVYGSRVLDSAALVPESTAKVTIADALSGLVAGLGVGLLAVLAGAILTDRPRRRQAIATGLGTPVVLSIRRSREPFWRRRHRLERLRRQPDPAVQMVARRLRSYLEASPGSRLATIAVEAAEPAALAVSTVATSLAAEGRRVVITDLARGHPLARLLGVKPTPGAHQVTLTPSGRAQTATVVVSAEDPAEMTSTLVESADARLVLATVDPALGADHLAAWVSDAVVMVTAGKASTVQLDATGQLLRRAGLAMRAAIVVGADADDESLGVLAEAP